MPEQLTTDDLIRSGACLSRVRSFRDQYFPDATAVSVESLLAVATGEESEYIREAAGWFGYGDGYGDGDGYGGYGDGGGETP